MRARPERSARDQRAQSQREPHARTARTHGMTHDVPTSHIAPGPASSTLITDASGRVTWYAGLPTGGLPGGAASGDILGFQGGSAIWETTEGDTGTVGNVVRNPMTALNDLAVGGTAGYPTRLATANSSFLQTDSSGNISWGAALSGGGMSNPMVATGDMIMDVDNYLLR